MNNRTPTDPQFVTLHVDRDGWTKSLQLSICNADGGHRMAGPKYNGSSTNLLACRLTKQNAEGIRKYLDAAFPADGGDLQTLRDQLTAERAEVKRLREVVTEKHADLERLQRYNAELLELVTELEKRVTTFKTALEEYAECGDGCTCGDGWSHDAAILALKGGAK